MWRKIFVDKRRAKFPVVFDGKSQIFRKMAISLPEVVLQWFFFVENRRDFRIYYGNWFKDFLVIVSHELTGPANQGCRRDYFDIK